MEYIVTSLLILRRLDHTRFSCECVLSIDCSRIIIYVRLLFCRNCYVVAIDLNLTFRTKRRILKNDYGMVLLSDERKHFCRREIV